MPHGYGWKEYNVSWREQPVRYPAYPTTNRVQLVLHAGGTIDMVYDRVMIPPGLRTYAARGLVMGRSPDESVPVEPDFGAVFREQMFVDFDAQQAFTVPPGTSVLEDLWVKYRQLLHERLRLLAWLVVGVSVFIVLVVPQFYRWSLTRPLERLLGGMKRVDSGDLDVAVPVGVNDEIGRLTHHFNSMTGSLREADAELRAYAEHLEERVAERTAELEAEKEKTEGQAARLADLDEAKSRFFANVSHELRTPLTLLLGPIRDALADDDREEALVQQLPMMRRSGERLLGLVERLLDLARLDAGRLRLRVAEADLVGLTRRIVLAFASRAEREGLALAFDADARTARRLGGPRALRAGALEPPRERDQVHAGGRAHPRDPRAPTRTRPSSPSATRARASPRTCSPTSSSGSARPTTPRRVGTRGQGSGSPSSASLVALHGGEVDGRERAGLREHVHRPPPIGEGALRRRRLRPGRRTPRLLSRSLPPDACRPRACTSRRPDAPTRADATVLVVEDHADMRAYLHGLLAPHYRVEEAEDGLAGLEAARRLAADGRTPDLVISDVMMPGLDGYALCHALKEDDALGHVPVVLLTARADEESRLEGLGEGADDYLAKPFSAEELLARCENLIEVRRRLRARFSGEVVVQPAGVVVDGEEADWVEEVKAACEAHLGDANFGVDWLADELGVSARTLQRRLKAASGLTPGAFLRTLRLERAAQLLEQGAGGVAEVASAVGYTDAEWFSRAFRQGFGVPPSAYAEGERPGA